jgi:glycosyltransferase involved in cell wall biosynthesis
MVTNTFTPHVGGVSRSVEGFTARFRELGHRVVVAAPQFEGAIPFERDVVRLRALQNFNGSDFSVPFPVTGLLRKALERCRPDIVHSHHPYLLGDTALRIAAAENVPIVFTHHTMYERYTHYIPGDSPRLQRFVVDLATGYCDLCDAVIAPSESVADILRTRGVKVPIEVIPTGVEVALFAQGDGIAFREAQGIPAGALVVGHVGRLAPEKNLGFLSRALAVFAERNPSAFVLIVGDGPCRSDLETAFVQRGVRRQLRLTGSLQWEFLPGAYRAMDVFAFASQSETQGMVLTEAMAAGVPAVAIDAPGVREVVRERYNGCLLPGENLEDFVGALRWVTTRYESALQVLRRGVAETAQRFSMGRTAEEVLALYQRLSGAPSAVRRETKGSAWAIARRRLREEWKLLANRAEAAHQAWRDPTHAEYSRQES